MVASLHMSPLADGDLLDNGQAQAAARAGGLGTGGIAPIEAFKQVFLIVRAEARAFVVHRQHHPAPAADDNSRPSTPIQRNRSVKTWCQSCHSEEWLAGRATAQLASTMASAAFHTSHRVSPHW